MSRQTWIICIFGDFSFLILTQPGSLSSGSGQRHTEYTLGHIYTKLLTLRTFYIGIICIVKTSFDFFQISDIVHILFGITAFCLLSYCYVNLLDVAIRKCCPFDVVIPLKVIIIVIIIIIFYSNIFHESALKIGSTFY